MADVQARAARVREHVEDVKFRFGRIEIFLARIWRVKKLPLFPDRLPFRLDLVERIRFAALAHRIQSRMDTNEHEFRKIALNTQLSAYS